MRVMTIVVSLAISPMMATAHHSRAEFSGDTVEIEGQLIAVSWINPHPTFKLQPSNGAGEVIDVQVYGGIGSLSETGVEESLFNIGDRVTVAGVFSNRRANLLLGTHAQLSSGLEAVLQYNANPRWTGERVGGLGTVTIDESILARAAAENRGLFRVWSTPSTAEAVEAMRARIHVYTPAALAARDEWDLTNNPITRCEPSWMPHAMVQPTPREFVDHGDRLTLNIAYFDSSRTIYLDNVPAETDRSSSRMGFSVGRWEGNTLVVETSRIDAPAYDGAGTLQSPEMSVVERFTLSDDQARLEYEAVMTDPIALQEPVIFRLQYLALGGELRTLSCDQNG